MPTKGHLMWYVAVIASDPEGSVEDVWTEWVEASSREEAAAIVEARLRDDVNDYFIAYLRPVPPGVVGSSTEPVRPAWLYPQ